jgi:hypothetical protein
MPAKSKKQQRLFGMVRAFQKGEMKSPSPKVASLGKRMKPKSVKKFAKTKRRGLPEKVRKEDIELEIRQILEGVLTPEQIQTLIEGHKEDEYRNQLAKSMVDRAYPSLRKEPSPPSRPPIMPGIGVKPEVPEAETREEDWAPRRKRELSDIVNIIMTSLDQAEINRLINMLNALKGHTETWQPRKPVGPNEDIETLAGLITDDPDVIDESEELKGGESIQDDAPMTEAGSDGKHICKLCGKPCNDKKECDTEGCANHPSKPMNEGAAYGDTTSCQKCGTQYTAGLKCPKCSPAGKYKGKGGESIVATKRLSQPPLKGPTVGEQVDHSDTVEEDYRWNPSTKNIVYHKGSLIECPYCHGSMEVDGRCMDCNAKFNEAMLRGGTKRSVDTAPNYGRSKRQWERLTAPIEGKNIGIEPIKENAMRAYKLIKEAARGRLTRRTHRMLDVASGGRVLTEDVWRDKVGDDNMKLAVQLGLLQPIDGKILGEEEEKDEKDTKKEKKDTKKDAKKGGESIKEQPPMVGGEEGAPPFGGEKPGEEAGEEEEGEEGAEGEEGLPSGLMGDEEEGAEEEVEEEEPITKDELIKFLEALKGRADDEALALIDKAVASEEEMEGEEEATEGEESEESEEGEEETTEGEEEATEDGAEGPEGVPPQV